MCHDRAYTLTQPHTLARPPISAAQPEAPPGPYSTQISDTHLNTNTNTHTLTITLHAHVAILTCTAQPATSKCT
jgi:hypothetical protein